MMISSINIEANPELTLEELCVACGITPDFIHDLVEYGVLEIQETSLEAERFTPVHLRRIRTIVHLQNDLEVNLPGAALVIDLMEQIETMRMKIEMLEKHIQVTSRSQSKK